MGTSDQDRPIPYEMAVPTILSWIEKAHHPPGLRVQGGDIRSLVAVAEETGEGEVLGHGGTVVLAGNDMIDRVRQGREGLGKLAVFASGDGPVARPSRSSVMFMRGVHAGVFQGEPCFGPENTKPVSHSPIAFHLALLHRRERSLLGFEGKLPHMPLILGTELDA